MLRGFIFLPTIFILLLVVAGAFLPRAHAMWGAIVMTIGGTVFAVCLIASVSYNWLRHRQANNQLRDRPQIDSVTFGTRYFAHNPYRAGLAARLRDSLATYLKLPLEGLLPDDDLNEVCDARTDDPSLVWYLEEEFQLGETFSDADEFESLEQKIRTFRGLVSFVESRIHQAQSPKSD